MHIDLIGLYAHFIVDSGPSVRSNHVVQSRQADQLVLSARSQHLASGVLIKPGISKTVTTYFLYVSRAAAPSFVIFMPNIHRRRRRDSTVELSHVGGVYGILV